LRSLNIEHCDHTFFEPNQSKQRPWVWFLNHLLACLLLYKKTLTHPSHFFYFQGKGDRHGWWARDGQEDFDKIGNSHGSSPSGYTPDTLQSKRIDSKKTE
jgi:hypothetical protein